jgi:hypothetical protein
MELPVLPDEPSARALADSLNLWERAWCAGTRAIAYVSLIPTKVRFAHQSLGLDGHTPDPRTRLADVACDPALTLHDSA